MQFTLGRTLTMLGVTFFLIVMLGTAASLGFFGNMFEGFFGGMFGEMFGTTVESIQTSTSTTGSGSRPLPTATVRR